MSRLESYSSLATLAQCSEKYRLSYVERLEAPGESLPMRSGSALDAALNVLYTTKWDYELAVEALRTSWGTTPTTLGGKHEWLTLPFLETRLRMYMEEREASPTILEEGEIIHDFSGKLHEFQWSDAQGNMVALRGAPDFALRHHGQVYVPDLKCTTSWLSDHWMLQFRIGNQLRVYAAMLQNLLGVQVSGGLINAIYMGEKALDPPDVWKKSKRKSVPSMLSKVDFTQEQILESHEWVRGLEAQRELHASNGLWPRNEKACDSYGGCEFLPLCTAPSKLAAKARMMTQFKRKEERTDAK